MFFLLLDSFGASAEVYIHNSSNFYKTVSYYTVDLFSKVVICAHSISNAHWAPFEGAWFLFANSNFCFFVRTSCPELHVGGVAWICQKISFSIFMSRPHSLPWQLMCSYVHVPECMYMYYFSLDIPTGAPSSLHIPTVVVPSKNKSEDSSCNHFLTIIIQ